MYNKIEIHDTENLEKYLLISNNNTLYIGIIVKDIVDFLKYGFTIDIIVKKINDKYSIQLSNQDVSNIKATIDKFLVSKKKSSLYKIVDFFNPNEISIPKSILNIFYAKYFYFNFFFFLIINSFTLINTTSQLQNKINSFSDNIIVLLALLFILFFHELGHSFSAKYFNLNVKEIGFGFYHFFPVFYVNLNESWRLKKDKRTIINLSGIYIQLIIGMFLTVFMVFFNENRLLLSIFKTNFYIILLNLNPFLKFDGYWVLSDLLEENNLLKTSNNLIKEKFKLKAINKFEDFIITIYTILRITFIAFIVLFVIKRIINIHTKYTDQSELSIDEGIFILLLVLYIFRILFNKLKKYLK